MERGIAAFGKGDSATALYEYERAMQLVPKANLPYRYAAEALLQLDRPRAAIDYLEKYLALNPNVSDAAAVRARIEGLRRERLPGKVLVQASMPGASVRVDHGPLQKVPCEVELAPGEHVLSLERDGHMTTEEHVRVVGGTKVEAQLKVGPRIENTPPGPGPMRETPKSGSSPVVVATALSLGGVGVLTLAASGVLDATLLRGKLSDLDAASRRGDVNLAEVKSDAASARTGVITGYVVGAVFAAVSGALLVWQWTRPPQSHSKTSRRHELFPFSGTF